MTGCPGMSEREWWRDDDEVRSNDLNAQLRSAYWDARLHPGTAYYVYDWHTPGAPPVVFQTREETRPNVTITPFTP